MADEGFKRKLAAILSADVEGYSRLMRDDEEATVRDIAARRVLISDIVHQHHGRVVDSPGDNILAEFASVVDAVNGAIKIQDEIKKVNMETPTDRRMEFRIGINLGDVIEEEERIYGDGVNIAARVEGLAAGGGIAISGIVYDSIKDKLSLGYHYLGEQDVKNIPEPVRVYRLLTGPEDAGKLIGIEKKPSKKVWFWTAAAAVLLAFVGLGIWQFYGRRPAIEPASVEKMAYPLPDKPSIAVLPFDNMSGDPEQGYFCDGLTEEIITALSKVPQIFVIARNSVFTYKGKPVKVNQVAEDLGVQYVLEGSVRKAGDKIRITAQLIDALSGHHLWAERYDRNLEEIFAIQDDLTKNIIAGMQVQLTEGEQARIDAKGTKNLEAYLKYLQADYNLRKMNIENNARAKLLAQEAIDLDPEFAMAYRALAAGHRMDVYMGASKSPKQSMATCRKLLEKAIELDPDYAEALAALGFTYSGMGNHDKAIATAERAVALDPNAADIHTLYAHTLRFAGRQEEAIPEYKKAIRLNPIPPSYYFFGLGMSYSLAGQHPEAIKWCEKAVRQDPDSFMANLILTAVYSMAGRDEDARTQAEEVLRLNPKYHLERDRKRATARYKDKWFAALSKAGIPDKPPLPLPDKPSIAVLPFENMSNDPDQEYFSDGLTDELIGDLAKISGILVISRNSAFTYKGKQVKISQIARELNVRYVLEGSVQKAGDKVRIRAQLIDGQTDHHLWAESYDGKMTDIFDLQDKITGKIVSALAVKLTPSEQKRIADKGTDNIFAYEAFLKGEEQFIIQTPESFLKAIEYYKQAIEFDPNFSRAYAAIGNTYQIGGNLAYSRRMGFSGGTMRLLARKYLELAMKNPSPEAYSLAAAKEIHRRNFQKSIAFAEKAYQHAPNAANRQLVLAWHLAFSGRTQESIELINNSIRLDPLDTQKHTPICFLFLGVNHFAMGNMEEAVTYLQKAQSLNPKLNNFSCFLAACHAYLGNDIEAKKALADYIKIFPKGWPLTIRFLYQAWPFKDSEVFDRFAQGLVKAGLPADPADYYKLNSQEKLNGQEVKKLLFGRTSAGYVWGVKPMHWSLHINDAGEVEYKYRGKTYTGKAWIEGEDICLLREKYHGGLKSCEAIYRNPDGDEHTQTEYFRVTDYGLFLFSVEK